MLILYYSGHTPYDSTVNKVILHRISQITMQSQSIDKGSYNEMETSREV